MLVDSDYEYGKHAQLHPRQYEFATTCNFGQAKEALNDPYCPDWAKNLLKQRFSFEFEVQKKDDDKKKAKKQKLLQSHPNADMCIAICDKLPLEKCFDIAFDIYEKNFA